VYQFWLFVHLAGVFGFLAAHGVSMAVTFRLRKERDPERVNGLLALSAASSRAMYPSLLVLLVGGVVGGFQGHWWSQGWIWAAIGVLVLALGGMYAVATPYYRRVRFIAQAMAGGSQAVSDEQWDGVLRSANSGAVMAIGFVALAAILYLMVFKPTFGMGGGAAAPLPSVGPSGSGAPCSPAGTSLTIGARNIAFDKDCLAAPADTPFTITFTNQDSVPHNVSIYTDRSASKVLFRGALQSSPGTIEYSVPALPAGTYFFRCDVHPTQMTGVFVVGG
jgi:plastocyanin